MKRKKLITLLGAAAISLSAAVVGAAIKQPTPAQAASNKKSVKDKSFTFAKTWRTKWYSTYYLTPSPMEIYKTGLKSPWTGENVKTVMGVVPKTAKTMVVTPKKMHGDDWLILTPAGARNNADTHALTSKLEKLNGKKHRVIFEANPDNGKVINQFFKSEKLAKKYGNHHFKDMTYSEISPR
ncbi:hypothetical protein PT285_02000 [Lactobacillus sp. ESL0791]|uniref:hypothetical protein n=1 Tax=Lactobacillus sp. ESL0791 TaxID=2983234 RepID=UPI0023F9CCDA|nr:hypothetical protein [Lactobacillus sp. ESL0791]MDF7638210.1 hypothetical protein [Lactobacillus sp. ESL0791]